MCCHCNHSHESPRVDDVAPTVADVSPTSSDVPPLDIPNGARAVVGESPRVWTSSGGQTRTGALVAVVDDGAYYNVDGVSRYCFDDSLCESDRQYVATVRASLAPIVDDGDGDDNGDDDDDDSPVCTNCGDVADCAHDGDDYCQQCFDDTFCSCADCGDVVRTDDTTTSDDGTTYCDSCYRQTFTTCHNCNCEVSRDDAREGLRGRDYCGDCFDKEFTTCDGCECVIRRDDSYSDSSGDGCYCGDCVPSDEDEEGPDVAGRRYYFNDDDTFVRTGSLRTFGVELETHECDGYADDVGATYFSAKHDGSIEGKEFVSRILRGDRGLDAIADFCDITSGWVVNNSCGYHAHIGVGDLDAQALAAVAVAYKLTERVWQSFVPSNRRQNSYCKAIQWQVESVPRTSRESFQQWLQSIGRYCWFNVAAYTEHTTFEIRLHTATLDANKVNNWVCAHIRFIDSVAKMTVGELTRKLSGLSDDALFSFVATCWSDDKLTTYYKGRARKWGTTYGDNVATSSDGDGRDVVNDDDNGDNDNGDNGNAQAPTAVSNELPSDESRMSVVPSELQTANVTFAHELPRQWLVFDYAADRWRFATLTLESILNGRAYFTCHDNGNYSYSRDLRCVSANDHFYILERVAAQPAVDDVPLSDVPSELQTAVVTFANESRMTWNLFDLYSDRWQYVDATLTSVANERAYFTGENGATFSRALQCVSVADLRHIGERIAAQAPTAVVVNIDGESPRVWRMTSGDVSAAPATLVGVDGEYGLFRFDGGARSGETVRHRIAQLIQTDRDYIAQCVARRRILNELAPCYWAQFVPIVGESSRTWWYANGDIRGRYTLLGVSGDAVILGETGQRAHGCDLRVLSITDREYVAHRLRGQAPTAVPLAPVDDVAPVSNESPTSSDDVTRNESSRMWRYHNGQFIGRYELDKVASGAAYLRYSGNDYPSRCIDLALLSRFDREYVHNWVEWHTPRPQAVSA